ncbi:MAG: ATP-binding cassette domain-containing protein [Chloroflexi bacterium]|nr:ATP-binding cassette domain-containing protein [Chloroflexota bacterium]
MIQVEGLIKDYGPRRAIDDLTFHAEKGEILGFLGPNGAGKTTTMRILTGFMPPTEGTARVAGFDIIGESIEVRRRVGYVPERISLYEDMQVFEYLKYMADLRHLPEAEERVLDTIEQVRMVERAESYISSLSKGMRQRIGLAQALLHQPEVLILDEPTIGLDPAQIIEVRNLIREMGKDRTVLLSTHILSEAQQVCDRVLIINKGRIVAEDTPEHLGARLSGAQHIQIEIGGDAEGLETLVEAIPGVDRIRKLDDGRFEFQAAPGGDLRPQVARAVVEGGYDLLEMKTSGLSLEEIFLKLTRDTDDDWEADDDA